MDRGDTCRLKFLTSTFMCLLFPLLVIPHSSRAQGDELLNILSSELDREWKVLSKAEVPAYYVSYRVEDGYSLYINTEFGSVINSSNLHQRNADVSVRIGDYAKDNTGEYLGGYGRGFYGAYGGASIPIENSKLAIAQGLWRITNGKYNEAKERYKLISNRDDADPRPPDFSKEQVAQYEDEPLVIIDSTGWQTKLKEISALFLASDSIVDGQATLSSNATRQYFLDTEGRKIIQNHYLTQLAVTASLVADNGEIIPLSKVYFTDYLDELPTMDIIKKDIATMIAELTALKNAPLAEPYTGPAILHPRAAGVFFHEIFGHRIEGHRLKSETDGQTFKEKLGQKVLAKQFNIYSDPTRKEFNSEILNGYYQYDDQGIAAEKVNVVSKGILNTFLMSRSPLENVVNSNGHGRSQIGIGPVARQSNLIIEAEKKYSMQKLRSMLIKECKAQKKEYGYYFVDVTGGFTRTDRYATNAFNIMPTLVYRVYTDGRPDELVRGVDLIGTPLAMFAEITAASDQQEVFNGICGAESGSVPVSAIAPGLLVRRIETQKKPVGQRKKEFPLLDRPQTEN